MKNPHENGPLAKSPSQGEHLGIERQKLYKMNFASVELADNTGKINEDYKRRLLAMLPRTFVPLENGDIIARLPVSNEFLFFFGDHSTQAKVNEQILQAGYHPANEEIKGRIRDIIREAAKEGLEFAIDAEVVDGEPEEPPDEIIEVEWTERDKKQT